MDDLADSLEEMRCHVKLLMAEREICRLLLALSRKVDEKDFDGLAALYAENGTPVTPWGSHRGRAGMADYVRNDLGHFHAMHMSEPALRSRSSPMPRRPALG